MSKITDLGKVTEVTNASFPFGRFIDGAKIFWILLQIWIYLTSDNDSAQPPKHAPAG